MRKGDAAKYFAGLSLGGLKRCQRGGGFAVSFQGGWDLEFSEKHGEASAGSGRSEWCTGDVETPQRDITKFTTLQWPSDWQPEPTRQLAASIPVLGPEVG